MIERQDLHDSNHIANAAANNSLDSFITPLKKRRIHNQPDISNGCTGLTVEGLVLPSGSPPPTLDNTPCRHRDNGEIKGDLERDSNNTTTFNPTTTTTTTPAAATPTTTTTTTVPTTPTTPSVLADYPETPLKVPYLNSTASILSCKSNEPVKKKVYTSSTFMYVFLCECVKIIQVLHMHTYLMLTFVLYYKDVLFY